MSFHLCQAPVSPRLSSGQDLQVCREPGDVSPAAPGPAVLDRLQLAAGTLHSSRCSLLAVLILHASLKELTTWVAKELSTLGLERQVGSWYREQKLSAGNWDRMPQNPACSSVAPSMLLLNTFVFETFRILTYANIFFNI